MERVLEMEKLSEFNTEEDIEGWLEVFECRGSLCEDNELEDQDSMVQECD